MTEMNLKCIENAIREAIKTRKEYIHDDDVRLILDHINISLFPDLVDRDVFNRIVFSMYNLMNSVREAEVEISMERCE